MRPEGSRPSPMHRRSASVSTPSAVDLERGLAMLQPLLRDEPGSPPTSTQDSNHDGLSSGILTSGPGSLSLLSATGMMPSVTESEGLMDRNATESEAVNCVNEADDRHDDVAGGTASREGTPPLPSSGKDSNPSQPAGKSWKWLWGVIRSSSSSRPWSRPAGQSADVSDSIVLQ